MCRMCENVVGRSIYEEHAKFCKKKVGHDIEVLSIDQELAKMISHLKNEPVLRLLLEKVLSTSARDGGFLECIGAKKQLDKYVADALSSGRELAEAPKCSELINRKIKSLQSAEIAVLQSPRLPSPNQSRTPVMDRHSTMAKIPSILDFEILKPIARGGYGGVYLARKKKTHDLYAIKALNRKEMIRRGEMKSIFAERNILATVHSEHVVKMFFAMASKKFLFFVMEFMAGGDTFALLRRFGRFDEQTTKFYIAEVVLALEDLHKQGVIHRDLKPDNILIGADGHVKLADFGLSAVGLINKQAREGEDPLADQGGAGGGGGAVLDAVEAPTAKSGSFSTNNNNNNNNNNSNNHNKHTVMADGQVKGTPHYLAPEVLLGLPHTQAVDWWALGVLMFEFLNGYPPFDGETVQDVFKEIFAGSINWPSAADDEMSPQCKDLIKRLLDNDADRRLQDAIKVKAHPFFLAGDPDFWLTLGDFEPPFVPHQTSEEDTSNFDERVEFFPITADDKVGKDGSDGSSSGSDDDRDDNDVSQSGFGGGATPSDDDMNKVKKDSGMMNFWHVNVQNLGMLNRKSSVHTPK